MGLKQQTSFACGALGKLRLPGFAGFEDADSCGGNTHSSGALFVFHGLGMYGRLPTAPLYKGMSRVQGSDKFLATFYRLEAVFRGSGGAAYAGTFGGSATARTGRFGEVVRVYYEGVFFRGAKLIQYRPCILTAVGQRERLKLIICPFLALILCLHKSR